MNKKIILLLGCLLFMAVMTAGCKKNENSPSADNTEHVENGGGKENAENAEGEISKGEMIEDNTQNIIPYPYVQELNIIEDNYRNFYEIFVGAFYDSDGDGMGDIQGVISKLDYINDGDYTTDTDLGFNGIWLMPVMPSSSYHKYDVTDYYDIDKDYGSLEDFKELIEACNKRGISLIIDFVFNHTSSQHPWFVSAVSYLESLGEGEEPDLEENPYVGYYNFTKEFSGSDKYHKAGSSDWNYEGVFWGGMPDLKLENPKVREEIEQIAKFWLDQGVSGFRLDAAKEFYSGAKEKNIEVLEWFTDYVQSEKKDAYIVAEVWEEAGYISEYYKSKIPSLFNFPLSQHTGLITKTARALPETSGIKFAKTLVDMDAQYRNSNEDYIDAPFISNHDTTRISAQCVNNEEQMKLAAGLLLTMNGSPYVYYGEEIGMNSLGSKDENKRLPMNWSVKDRTGIPNPPVGAEKVEQKFPSLEEQLEDPLSIYNYYKRAVRIRNENPEIARGTLSMVEELCSEKISVLKKVYNDSEIVIIYNLGEEEAKVSLGEAFGLGLSVRGYLTVDGSEVILSDTTVSMPNYSIVILK